MIELLVPELQRRGIFWKDYHVPGGTYRENLYEAAGQHEPLADHPAAAMIWRPEAPVANGISNHATNAREDGIDPMSMQLG